MTAAEVPVPAPVGGPGVNRHLEAPLALGVEDDLTFPVEDRHLHLGVGIDPDV